MELENARVTIVGLGLMGGSMALRLQPRCRQLVGVESNRKTAEIAHSAGITIRGFDSAIANSDVIVLATPVKESLRLLEGFQEEPPDVDLLMDIGSTKRQIVEAMELLPAHVAAVGGHPLCGKERAGFQEADPKIFNRSMFVLTPCSRSSPSSLELAEQIVSSLGATALFMEAARHDELLAGTSHLPYLVATALIGAVEPLGHRYPELWDLVATGFLGTSRLAASDLTMMVDILTTNQDLVENALSGAQAELGKLRTLINDGKAGPLREYLEPLQQRRVSLQDRRSNSLGA
jgi:prephenate dehydrogenase